MSTFSLSSIDARTEQFEFAPLDHNHPNVVSLRADYGHLITHDQLAALLGRSGDALRQRLSQGTGHPWTLLRAGRRRIGRRCFYDARFVAVLLAGDRES